MVNYFLFTFAISISPSILLINYSYFSFSDNSAFFESSDILSSHSLLNSSRSLKHAFLFSNAIFNFYLFISNSEQLEKSIVLRMGLPSS